MTRRLLLLLAPAVLVFLPSMVMSGCCLTSRLWEWASDRPLTLEGVVLDEHHVLHMAVRYDSGDVYLLRASLTPDPEWTRATAVRVRKKVLPLPETPFEMTRRPGREPGPNQVDISYVCARDKQGGGECTVWVDGAGCQCIVTLPEPRDWSSAAPYVALVATPFALVADFVTAPIWVAWVILTAGGHGDCWLPWCD